MAAGYDGSLKFDTKMDTKGFNTGVKDISAGLAGIRTSLMGIAKAMGLAFGVAAIINFGRESVKAVTQLSDAITGLRSILRGQGRSFKDAQRFINGYISDGLIPATNAITAYKNLALRGYSDDQIQKTLVALKDAAAFGRQASYSLGDAVTSATEGLRQENSILVDNAGVTRNVAKMWEDYAKRIGTTSNRLTQQQKIQAEIEGILEETKYQTGDAARAAGEYSGQVMKLSFGFNNLKVAVGNALMPILWKVLPVLNAIIAALTRVANLAAQVTQALFGRVTKQQIDAGKSAAVAAGEQDKLTESIEKTGKAAKSLAGFDELNVLPANSGEGAGNIPTPDVGAGMGPLITEEDTAESEEALGGLAKSIVDTLHSIRAAAQPLIDVLSELGGRIGEGLLWLYDNVLVPLGSWVISDYLPAFFANLAATIGVLNPLINALKPLALWLWEEWLRPLATWTGGIIVDVLWAIADALYAVGNWIADNQEAVRGITIALGLFFAAWEVTSLAEFIINAGGVVGLLGKLKKAIMAVTWAKLVDKAETLGLVLLYAKDFAVAIASTIAALIKSAAAWIANTAAKVANTVATVAMTVATAAWNAIAVIAAAVTTAFGAAVAFLTSPIGLVLLAIAALIAIVVLLVKNWDEVKAVGAAAWAYIQNAWKAAGEWFRTKIITPVAKFFKDLWQGIKDAGKAAWEFVVATWQNAGEWVKKTITDPVAAYFTGLWDSIKSVWQTAATWFSSQVMEPIKDVFKSGINFLIGIAEGFVNAFIGGINYIISGLNKLSFSVPSWVPGIGGQSWGISISPVQQVKIPRLATGAVIPPNSEFLAILGDQKSGTNIEAPLDTIVAAVTTALDARESREGNNQAINLTLNFAGSMAQFVRTLKPELAREDRRKGANLIIGGSLS